MDINYINDYFKKYNKTNEIKDGIAISYTDNKKICKIYDIYFKDFNYNFLKIHYSEFEMLIKTRLNSYT